MICVYILECADGSYYVGSTRSIDLRLEQHASGHGARYTSTRLPVRLAWAQEYDTVAEAYAIEKKLQGWSRAKREALISGNVQLLPGLSRRGGSKG
jgi:putative endonuclease